MRVQMGSRHCRLLWSLMRFHRVPAIQCVKECAPIASACRRYRFHVVGTASGAQDVEGDGEEFDTFGAPPGALGAAGEQFGEQGHGATAKEPPEPRRRVVGRGRGGAGVPRSDHAEAADAGHAALPGRAVRLKQV